ncbi:hypothetical protein [Micromonospora maritima]|uniref:hypothetical protein n=1 Tax=Micromonospora maritima TaxID=986711 RepID=UPI00157CA7BC|nr:hypothetical protein [Micromonospora maritima]
MRIGSPLTAGILAVGLGMPTGWFAASAGGSIERAPTALLVMTIGLTVAGLLVGLVRGRRNHRIWPVVLVLLCSFHAGTWLGSPHHSAAGDALVLAVAAAPAGIGAALGIAVGRHLAARRDQPGPLTSTPGPGCRTTHAGG